MPSRRAGWRSRSSTGSSSNEAFAAQSLAVMRSLDLDPARVNPLGGAIALGHPLGATGAIRTATVMSAMQRDPKLKYGMVTMCIGTGMGAAGIFEREAGSCRPMAAGNCGGGQCAKRMLAAALL